MQLSLIEGSVSKALVRFSLPFLLGNIIQMAYSSVDVLFLSWFSSPSSLAGASNGVHLVMTAMNMFMGLSSGGMILLGQHFGAKRDDKSAVTTGNIIILQIMIVIVMTAIVLTLGNTFVTLLNVPAEPDVTGMSAADEALNYLRVCSAGFAFAAGYNMISSILRALGNSRAPLIFVAMSCTMNIVIDYFFVGVFHWGASGAALATVISQAFSFTVSTAYLLVKKLPYKFSFRYVRPEKATLLRILRLGIPISLQIVLNAISFMAISAVINNMGMFAAAANGVVVTVINFYMVIPLALGSAISAFSAQNYGAGKFLRALKATKLGIGISLIIATPLTLLANLFPSEILSLMSPVASVVSAGTPYLISFSWDFMFVGFIFCINGLFNGCGITTFVALHETIAAFCVRIPVSWLLSGIAGATLFHVGIGTPAASLLSLVMCLFYYRAKFYKKLEVR